MSKKLDLSGFADLDIEINSKHSLVAVWTRTLNGVPDNWTGVHKVTIAKESDGKNVKMVLRAGSGLTIVDNVLTWDKTVILNTLLSGTYYYDWRSDSGGYSTPITKGILIVNSTIGQA